MTTNNFQQSAKIYQFPVRSRRVADRMREEAAPVVNIVPPRLAKAASSSAWYHDAAIQESVRSEKSDIADIVSIRWVE